MKPRRSRGQEKTLNSGGQKGRIRQAPKYGTLAWLAQKFFDGNLDSTLSVIRNYTEFPASWSLAIYRSGDGRKVWRTDMQGEEIGYETFGPPELWGPPYSIHKAYFTRGKSQTFMIHRGEELLWPIEGQITFRFMYTKGGSPPEEMDLEKPLEVGDIIRINSQLPHAANSVDANASAWMAFRDASDNPTSIATDSRLPGHERVVEPDKLSDPAVYAMAAWGISQAIKLQRERARLSIKDVAAHLGLAPAQLSRLEHWDSKGNISLSALVRVAQFLQVPLADLIQEATWYRERGSLKLEPAPTGTPVLVPVLRKVGYLPHYLHPRLIHVPQGFAGPIQEEQVPFASWIVLAGRALITLGDGSRRTDLVDQGSVLHFRMARRCSIEALTAVTILEITYSTSCTCSA